MSPIAPTQPKTKFPRAAAMAAAAELCRALKPACERLVVAGSLRRRRAEVGDIEILYVPAFQTVPDGLFHTKKENRVDCILAQLLAEGLLRKRRNKLGSEIWGEENKFAVHVQSGIPVDLFQCRPASWFSYLVCRTGGAENNVRIASAALTKGWKWHPYGRGFSDQEGRLIPVESEQDVFRLVGLPYLEPWQR